MDTSFGARLWHRRVPQYVGMYVAATWLAIEMGDWVTQRFGLPEVVTSYVFVGMLALLPSVALLAWGHGAPGKDKWTLFETVFLPVNTALAAFAIAILVEPTSTLATEMMDVVNEDGQIETYEVPLAGYHQDVLAMFWRSTDEDPDEAWLDYGLPAMLAEDLSRSPLLSLETPLDSAGLRESLKRYGSDDGRVSSQALSLQIARKGLYEYLLTGEWGRMDNGSFQLIARLFSVENGELLAEFTRQGEKWFTLVDLLSSDLRQELAQANSGNTTLVTDLKLSEHLSSSEAAIKLWVEANVARGFANDYAAAIEALVKAIEIDPTFALANGQLGMAYRMNAQNEAGIKAIEQALRHDYKLSTRDRFMLRANRYAALGEMPKAIRVLEMWTEIEPQSVSALKLLARNYMVSGDHLDEASAAFAAVRKLDPQAIDTILAQAQVEQQRRDFAAANEYIELYLASRPDDYRALLLQGRVRSEVDDVIGARESYENAAIVQGNEIDAELGLIALDLRQGLLDQMAMHAESLLEQPLTPSQQVAVQAQLLAKLAIQGRLLEALELAEEIDQLAQTFMVPLARILGIGTARAQFHAQRGELEVAVALMDEMTGQIDPPMDGIVTFFKLGVLQVADAREQFRQTMLEVEVFREEVQLTMLDPFFLQYQALMASWDGHFEQALKQHQQAQLLMESSIFALQDPRVLPSMQVQKSVYLNQIGRPEEAVELLRSLLARFPADPIAMLELASILVEQGQTEEAVDTLSQLFKLWGQADSEYLDYQRAQALSARIN